MSADVTATGAAAPVEPLPCKADELRTLFLFEKLTDDQLSWLCERGHAELIGPGPVYAEGEPATCFYVLLEGTVGMVPLAGDAFDVFFRANRRNVALLRKHFARVGY